MDLAAPRGHTALATPGWPSADAPGRSAQGCLAAGLLLLRRQRKIKPGKLAQCGKNFQYGTDMMYDVAPAALGVCEYTADDVEDATWSRALRGDSSPRQ